MSALQVNLCNIKKHSKPCTYASDKKIYSSKCGSWSIRYQLKRQAITDDSCIVTRVFNTAIYFRQQAPNPARIHAWLQCWLRWFTKMETDSQGNFTALWSNCLLTASFLTSTENLQGEDLHGRLTTREGGVITDRKKPSRTRSRLKQKRSATLRDTHSSFQ